MAMTRLGRRAVGVPEAIATAKNRKRKLNPNPETKTPARALPTTRPAILRPTRKMNDTNDCSEKSTPAATRPFGPFAEIPIDQITLAGFRCPFCKHPVERYAKTIPNMVPRVLFFACRCFAAVCWEDESKPTGARVWRLVNDLAKETGARVLMFNGNRPLSPDFMGIN
jgi:hypothetical protein